MSCTPNFFLRFPEAEPYVRYLPVMVARIMLSLKKAALSEGDQWSFGEPTTFTGVRFASDRDHDTPGDGIALKTFRSKGRGGAWSSA